MRKIRQPQYIRSRQSHITFQRSNARKRKRKGVDNHASHSSVQTPESKSGKVLKCDYGLRKFSGSARENLAARYAKIQQVRMRKFSGCTRENSAGQHAKIQQVRMRKFSGYTCENSASVHAKIQQVNMRKFSRYRCENLAGSARENLAAQHAKIQQVCMRKFSRSTREI